MTNLVTVGNGFISISCSGSIASTATTAWQCWVNDIYLGSSGTKIVQHTASSIASTTTAAWQSWVNEEWWDRRTNQNYEGSWIETPAERQAREAKHVKYMAEQKAKEEKQAQARTRARSLLTRHLSGNQRACYDKHGFFEVVIESANPDGKLTVRTYRIRQGTHGNVRLLKDGKEIISYCIQPNGVPAEDAMLAQKLLLETDESKFLRIANARGLN